MLRAPYFYVSSPYKISCFNDLAIILWYKYEEEKEGNHYQNEGIKVLEKSIINKYKLF